MRSLFRQPRQGRVKTLARLAGAAVMATVLAAVAAPSGAAAASVGCGSACDGKDPQTYVALVGSLHQYCYQDAITVATATNVELRYSPSCRTAWARQTDSIGWLSGALVQSFNANGTVRKTYTNENTGGLWSLMVNDKDLVARACFYQYDSETDYPNNKNILYCTSKY